jgi:hypothetical protein
MKMKNLSYREWLPMGVSSVAAISLFFFIRQASWYDDTYSWVYTCTCFGILFFSLYTLITALLKLSRELDNEMVGVENRTTPEDQLFFKVNLVFMITLILLQLASPIWIMQARQSPFIEIVDHDTGDTLDNSASWMYFYTPDIYRFSLHDIRRPMKEISKKDRESLCLGQQHLPDLIRRLHNKTTRILTHDTTGTDPLLNIGDLVELKLWGETGGWEYGGYVLPDITTQRYLGILASYTHSDNDWKKYIGYYAGYYFNESTPYLSIYCKPKSKGLENHVRITETPFVKILLLQRYKDQPVGTRIETNDHYVSTFVYLKHLDIGLIMAGGWFTEPTRYEKMRDREPISAKFSLEIFDQGLVDLDAFQN